MIKKKIGLAHGVFDILHTGHLLHFEECKKYCDELIVSITDDEFVNKGPNRPFINSLLRSRLLKNIKFVDKVIINKDYTSIELIKKIKPDYYFKGKDYLNLADDFTKNIIKEKKAVEKNGGKLFITDTDLKSSSSIINNDFKAINDDLRSFLKTINKVSITNFFKKFKKLKNKKKILVFGEPIIDKYTYVKTLGKSQKNQIISTENRNESFFGGGTILVSNLLTNFFNKIDFLCINNSFNNKFYQKFLNKKIKKISVSDEQSKITVKNRFVNYYRGERLFQNNFNNSQSLSKAGEERLIKKFKNLIKRYDKILIFDYGHDLISDKILNLINKNKKKFFINCQSNSSNFGFNLATKYKGGETICMDEIEFRLCVGSKNEPIDSLINKNQKFINRFKNFIITMGKSGCLYIKNKKKNYIPVVFEYNSDTTGFGDIFFTMIFFLSISSNLKAKEISLLSHISSNLHKSENSNFKNIDLNFINKIYSNIIK